MHAGLLDEGEAMMPIAIEFAIMALCADYPRRAEVIESKNATYRIIMEYRFLNYRMLGAAVEIAGTRDALLFIKEIGSGVGYAASELWSLSESIYKDRKREVKRNIARRLCLYE
nr:hypothetical protein [Oscillospiraceae bacterium]